MARAVQFACAGVAALSLLCACATKNVGSPMPLRGPINNPGAPPAGDAWYPPDYSGSPNFPGEDGNAPPEPTPPPPPPEPEPDVETDEERLARIESALRSGDYYDRFDTTAEELIWYANYWETHDVEDYEPSDFPVQGSSVIEQIDFRAPNTLLVKLNSELCPDGNSFRNGLWNGDQPPLGWPSVGIYNSSEHIEPEFEVPIHFSLIGPERTALPITVRAVGKDYEDYSGQRPTEELTIYLPVPKLDISTEWDGHLLHVASLGDEDELSSDSSTRNQIITRIHAGALVDNAALVSDVPEGGYSSAYTDVTISTQLPLAVDYKMRFRPQLGKSPVLVLWGRSEFWAGRILVYEFDDLPVKGWRYDYPSDTLEVGARDDNVLLTVELPEGKVVPPLNSGSASFAVPRAAAPYDARLQVQDGGEFTYYELVLGTATCAIPDNSLRCWPLQETVGVGEPVRIVVASGLTWHPFFYMTGVRVVAPPGSGFRYFKDSFNVGAPGGSIGDPDGGWARMGTQSYLLAPDAFMTGWGDRIYVDILDFNLTPLDGTENYFVGELFNFEATFDEPGTYQLGFEAVEVVSRTYYQNKNQSPDYFWHDISNANTPGLPSGKITVE